MARSFDGIDDSGSVAVDLSGTSIITVAFWLLWDSFTNNDDLAFEFTANYNGNAGGFIVDPNSAGGTWETGFNKGGFYCRATIVRPSGAVWHHYGIVMDRTVLTSGITPITVDGTPASITYAQNDSFIGVPFANSTLNLMCRNGASLFGAGDLAEVAIWSVALTNPQRASRAAGASPLSVQASDLELYVPLDGSTPELDLGPNGYTVTITGATPAAGPPLQPDPPSNLVATALSATSIGLVWDDNSSDETSFRVERSPTGAGSWVTAGTPAANAEAFTDTGRTCATQYFYRVFAVNGAGDSTASNTDDATTSACPPPSTSSNRMGGSGAIRKPPRVGR